MGSQIVANAAGLSDFYPVSNYGEWNGQGIQLHISDGASLPYSLEFTNSPLGNKLPISVSRTTTTATATFKVNHGLQVGDVVVVGGIREDNLVGNFKVASVPAADQVTYTVADTGATSAEGGYAVPLAVDTNADADGVTGDVVTNFVLPPSAFWVNVTSYTSGRVTANIRSQAF